MAVRHLKRSFFVVFTSLMMLLALVAFPVMAQAASTDANGIDFYVKALIPENQLDTNKTYFDLRMQPGETQTLEVEVFNEGSNPITVNIDTISASTNRNGLIDYKTPDVRDETLLYPFSELANVENSELTIPGGGSKTAQITVSMPDATYDGIVLGGIQITKQNDAALSESDEKQSDATMTLDNVFSYVIGVQLSETDTPVAPDFEFVSVQPESVNYRASLTHYIRNKEAAIAKNIDIDVVVLKKGTDEVVAKGNLTDIEMAPNSVMPFAISPENGELQAGDYTSVLNLTYNGQTTRLEQSFTVSGEEVSVLDKEIIPTGTVAASMPMWIVYVFGGVVVILLAIILILVVRRKKDSSTDSRNQTIKRK